MFEKFAEFPLWGWILVALLLVAGVLLMAKMKDKSGKKKLWTTKMLSMGAICMALSSVLSMIRLWSMPMGGSITPASMLPTMLFAYVYGVGPGCTLGVLYGVMQFMLDGGNAAAYGFVPMLLDYPIAFGLMGLAGLFRRLKDVRTGLTLGMIAGCIGRFAASFTSGVVFYGAYAPEGWNPVWYSIAYNGAYMGVECIICAVLTVLVGERLVREVRKGL